MGKFLFRIARIKFFGFFVGFMFAYFPFLIPVKKIMQNKKVVTFKHPSATYPNHILIIPRKIARDIFSLSNEDFTAVIDTALKIHNGDDSDFVVLINGGNRQDVMQAHFHMFTGNLAARKGLKKEIGSLLPSVSDLRDLLKLYGVSENAFSMFIQFEKDSQMIYFT